MSHTRRITFAAGAAIISKSFSLCSPAMSHDVLADVKSFFESILTARLHTLLNFSVLSLPLHCLKLGEFWAPREVWNTALDSFVLHNVNFIPVFEEKMKTK